MTPRSTNQNGISQRDFLEKIGTEDGISLRKGNLFYNGRQIYVKHATEQELDHCAPEPYKTWRQAPEYKEADTEHLTNPLGLGELLQGFAIHLKDDDKTDYSSIRQITVVHMEADTKSGNYVTRSETINAAEKILRSRSCISKFLKELDL